MRSVSLLRKLATRFQASYASEKARSLPTQTRSADATTVRFSSIQLLKLPKRFVALAWHAMRPFYILQLLAFMIITGTLLG